MVFKVCKRKSTYAPYYAKIQDLLFQGMPIKEVWLYMQIFFGIYADLNTFRHYLKVSGLQWFITNINLRFR